MNVSGFPKSIHGENPKNQLSELCEKEIIVKFLCTSPTKLDISSLIVPCNKKGENVMMFSVCRDKTNDLIKSDNVLWNYTTFLHTFLSELYNIRTTWENRVLYDQNDLYRKALYLDGSPLSSRVPLSWITCSFNRLMSTQDLVGEINGKFYIL